MGHREPYLYTNDLDGLTRTLLPSPVSQLQLQLQSDFVHAFLGTRCRGHCDQGEASTPSCPSSVAQLKSGGTGSGQVSSRHHACLVLVFFFLFPRKRAPDLDLDSQPLFPSPPLLDRGADIVRIVMMAEMVELE